jgi:Phosphotransferase enzyme family
MTQSHFLTHIETTLASFNQQALTLLVSAVIGRARAQICNWSHQRLSGGMGGGVGGTAIYRLEGDARTPPKSDIHHWSLIVKVVQARQGETSSDSHWWRREAEAYQSGILHGLSPHMTAPRFIDITEYPGESCWLWLEDVPDDHPGQWSLEQHIITARHLGQFSATHIHRRPLPHLDWLSQSWIRQDVNRFGRQVLNLDELRQHPLVARWLTDKTMANLQHLWTEREVFLSALESLPETMCHYDAFRRNLLYRDNQLIMIDWSFVGHGPLGAELVAPFWVNAIYEEIDVADLKTLDTALFDSYVTGLRDAGWHGNVQQVRLGYCAALGLRWLAGVGIQAGEIAQKLATGQPISASYIESMLEAGYVIDSLVDEARAIIARR